MALSFLAPVVRWLTAQVTVIGDLTPIERTLTFAELAIGLGALVLLRRLRRPRPRTRSDQVDYLEAA